VSNYYNEIDPAMAAWLRELIRAGHIPQGDVDTRSIKEVQASDLKGRNQCHFFAGIGGWPLALRLAGWRDDRRVWTGSCPCQPFSIAGKGAGVEDERHLWPVWLPLIEADEPPTVFGEQVAGTPGVKWADRVAEDFEALGYSFGAAVLQGPLVGAPHQRDRFYFVADAGRTDPARRTADRRGITVPQEMGEPWGFTHWNGGMPDPRLLDDGIPRHMAKSIVGGFGNAIIPGLAAEFIIAADAALAG